LNIGEFAGEPLRLMIADHATGPWGFIDATNFRLAGDNCAPLGRKRNPVDVLGPAPSQRAPVSGASP
jgi:hypothetical protein